MDQQSRNLSLVCISSLLFMAMAMSMMTTMTQATANLNDGDESWNLEKHYRHAHHRDNMAKSSMVHGSDVRRIVWSGVTSCRAEMPIKSPDESTDDHLPQSSTCPWYWIINYDPHRRPSTLLVAQCACSTCLNTGSRSHRCQPVHYFREVIYLKGGRAIPTLYRLPVGCTCERYGSH